MVSFLFWGDFDVVFDFGVVFFVILHLEEEEEEDATAAFLADLEGVFALTGFIFADDFIVVLDDDLLAADFGVLGVFFLGVCLTGVLAAAPWEPFWVCMAMSR